MRLQTVPATSRESRPLALNRISLFDEVLSAIARSNNQHFPNDPVSLEICPLGA